MAFKDSLLFRLVEMIEKRGQEKEAGEEGEESLLQMGQEDDELAALLSQPSAPDPMCLQLPQEHALNQLWRLRSEQAGWLPVPVLRLEGTQEQRNVLKEEMAERELNRLLQMVTSTAEERLAEALPVKETKAVEKQKELPEETDVQDGSAPGLDALAEVFLTEDEMTAWLLIYPPVGKGREVDYEMLENALQKKNVIFGRKDKVLEGILQHPDRYFHLFLAAQGKQAVAGADGQVLDLFPRSQKLEVLVDGFGNVNYTELDFVHNVEEGETICHIIPPVESEPGRTVTNREILLPKGKKPLIPKGRNTEVTEDGRSLIATKAGHVEFSGQSFQVKPVLEITGNVDYSTGNINFLGDVHIKGNVCTGFSVRATGGITVDGLLEACTVEAGGDLIVKKGIKGDQQSIIRSGRGIYAKYLESAVVCAKEHLETDCIINCNIYSNGDVQVCSGRGILIGGIVRASCEVKATSVGSRSEHRTRVYLGGLPGEEFELECLTQEIKELEAEYEKLECQPDSPVKARKLGMARMKLSVNRKKQEQFARYLEDMKKSMQTQAEGEEEEQEEQEDSRRLVCSTAYAGTEIHIGDAVLFLNREVRPCTAVLIKGKVCLI